MRSSDCLSDCLSNRLFPTDCLCTPIASPISTTIASPHLSPLQQNPRPFPGNSNQLLPNSSKPMHTTVPNSTTPHLAHQHPLANVNHQMHPHNQLASLQMNQMNSVVNPAPNFQSQVRPQRPPNPRGGFQNRTNSHAPLPPNYQQQLNYPEHPHPNLQLIPPGGHHPYHTAIYTYQPPHFMVSVLGLF